MKKDKTEQLLSVLLACRTNVEKELLNAIDRDDAEEVCRLRSLRVKM